MRDLQHLGSWATEADDAAAELEAEIFGLDLVPWSGSKQQAARVVLGVDTAGVDGNRHPDWAKAKVQVPLDFAIIRAAWGTAPDSAFAREWPRLKAAGLLRGAYLFLRFRTRRFGPAPDPAAQARAFVATVKDLKPSDLPPSLDVEFPGDGRGETGLTAQQVLGGVRRAWQVLRDHYGVAPIVYTSGRVWRADLLNLPAPDLVESPLWLANYGNLRYNRPAITDPRQFAAARFKVAVPPPWGDASNWWIHQYQGDALHLPGFSRTVDMNRFNPMDAGATGHRVTWVQRRLNLRQSGVFDITTQGAVRDLQSRSGLRTTGTIDPRTFARLCWENPRASGS